MSAPLNTAPVLSGTGPPPRSSNQTNSRTYKGHGDPNGRVLGYQGDEYIDLDTGAEWHKLTDNSGKETLDGWSTEGLTTPTSNPARLLEWAMGEAYVLSSIQKDPDEVVTSAIVTWPDLSSGVYTLTEKNETFDEADAWTLTHTTSGKTVTQPTLVRNSDGEVTDVPTPIIS
jgi:hypothetical protein